MRILFLVPQAIEKEHDKLEASRSLIYALANRGEQLDVVTHSSSVCFTCPNVHLYALPAFLRVDPSYSGFHWKRMLAAFFMLFHTIHLITRRHYDIIHAIDETVFIAAVFRLFVGIPYVYDLEYLPSRQLVQRSSGNNTLATSLLKTMEKTAIRRAQTVIVANERIREFVSRLGAMNVIFLDERPRSGEFSAEQIRQKYDIHGPMLMYVGNLETYQGIDLLLESFSLVHSNGFEAHLVIIGGNPANIAHYRQVAQQLEIGEYTHFIGPRAINQLDAYLRQADILVSPRIKGNNTPMKIYSYLHSGKACLATNLWTHLQVLNQQIAMLAEPNPRAFSDAMMALIENSALREKLGQAGAQWVQELSVDENFLNNLDSYRIEPVQREAV